ncbi:MAG: phosphate-starvation-inducible PsiE family protein, partial [Vulcanimicrobiaceae bacterium]
MDLDGYDRPDTVRLTRRKPQPLGCARWIWQAPFANAALSNAVLKPMHESNTVRVLTNVLTWFERVIFFLIGAVLFFAAIALLFRAGVDAIGLFAPTTSERLIVAGGQFLDVILVTLMFVELAYTMVLSVRGQVLLAEPFLIVGLIAVIRRILVLTIGEVTTKPTSALPSGIPSGAIELFILSLVVVAF